MKKLYNQTDRLMHTQIPYFSVKDFKSKKSLRSTNPRTFKGRLCKVVFLSNSKQLQGGNYKKKSLLLQFHGFFDGNFEEEKKIEEKVLFIFYKISTV